MASLKEKYIACGQDHIFDLLETIDDKLQMRLESLDLNNLEQRLIQAKSSSNNISTDTNSPPSPLSKSFDFRDKPSNDSEKLEIEEIGYEAIRTGTVAAVIMSGGECNVCVCVCVCCRGSEDY